MSESHAKYCPLCGAANPVFASFCESCDADLMNAPVEALRTVENVAAPEPATVTPAAHIMPEPAVSGIETDMQAHPATAAVPAAPPQPMSLQAVPPSPALELELAANPALRFRILPGQTVGRSERAEVVLSGVPDLEYISRAHARFIQRRDQWYVQYIAEGNSITVDGVVSADDAEIALYDGSVVVLSFTPFRVKLAS